MGYLIEPTFRLEHSIARSGKTDLLLEIFTDRSDHRDSAKLINFMNYLSIATDDWINRDSSINMISVAIFLPDIITTGRYKAGDSITPIDDSPELKRAMHRVKIIGELLPFNYYAVIRGFKTNTVDIELELTNWLRTHKDIEFDEYANILENVMFDYALKAPDVFSKLYIRYLDYDSNYLSKRVRQYTFDARSKSI